MTETSVSRPESRRLPFKQLHQPTRLRLHLDAVLDRLQDFIGQRAQRRQIPAFHALQRLIDPGIPVDGASDLAVSAALSLRDPDQDGIKLYWDRPETEWPPTPEGEVAMFTRRLDRESLRSELELGPSSEILVIGDIGVPDQQLLVSRDIALIASSRFKASLRSA